MSQFDMEQEDDLGNPWLAIVIGIACLAVAWYIYAKVGTNPQMIGKAAIANSSPGRWLFIGLSMLVGIFFIGRGIGKLKSND
ncbi:MAG: hypothetical protein V4723_07900 [Pseudomonadota bacterium]